MNKMGKLKNIFWLSILGLALYGGYHFSKHEQEIKKNLQQHTGIEELSKKEILQAYQIPFDYNSIQIRNLFRVKENISKIDFSVGDEIEITGYRKEKEQYIAYSRAIAIRNLVADILTEKRLFRYENIKLKRGEREDKIVSIEITKK